MKTRHLMLFPLLALAGTGGAGGADPAAAQETAAPVIYTAAAPVAVEGGYLFTFESKDAHKVYLAGDFNNFADNDNGRVNDPAFEMTRQENGVWTKILSLEPGAVRYKYVVANDQGECAWQPDPFVTERDKDDNTVLDLASVRAAGAAPLPSPEDNDTGPGAPKAVAGGFLFTFESADAHKVYLAGDFNNWANNDNGRVSDPACEMERGGDGVWRKVLPLNPGEVHYKFVAANAEGECSWHPDLHVSGRDKDDNTMATLRDRRPAVAASAPRPVEGGYLFTFESKDAQKVYLAGDFNNFANNDNGRVTDPSFEMERGEDGIWKKIVALTPGAHAYKFVVENDKGEHAWHPDPQVSSKDKDDNTVFEF